VTFRDIITWAIENGVRQYKSGALIYEPKKRLDCRFIPTFIYTKHMNRLLNPFLGIIFSFLSPERHDPTLREMKAKGLL
jgi:hypothetical protein